MISIPFFAICFAFNLRAPNVEAEAEALARHGRRAVVSNNFASISISLEERRMFVSC